MTDALQHLHQAIESHLERIPVGAFPTAVAIELVGVIGAGVADEERQHGH